jgi:hypothetical protein
MSDMDLFSVNFCHPPTMSKWNEAAPACLALMNKDACMSAMCQWSTGQELLPVDEVKSCLPTKVSLDAQAYETCNSMTETTCGGTCKYYTKDVVQAVFVQKPICVLINSP